MNFRKKYSDEQIRRVFYDNRMIIFAISPLKYEPRHDKTNKVTVRPVKTQISLGIRPV